MGAPNAIAPRANDDPASTSPRLTRSDRYKLVVGCCIEFSMPAILGVLMIIFLAIPALNISTTHVTTRWNIALSVKNPSKLISVKYAHMKLLLSFQGQLALSRPSLIPAFTQVPGNVTIVRAEALSMVVIINDLGVKSLVSSLKGGEVTIDVAAKSKRRPHLGPHWVPLFDGYVSCMGTTFTAPTESEGRGDWMILGGTLSCTPDIFTLLW